MEMNSHRGRRYSVGRWAGIAGLLVGLFLTGPTFAQDEAPKESPPAKRVTRDLLQMEGKRALRDAYFESRRQKPGDPSFDAGRARLEAFLSLENGEGVPPSGPKWVNIGPAPTTDGQTPTHDPRIPSDVSGRTSAIAFDDFEDAVYIGGAQGGVWRSTDDGASWTPLTDDLASTAIGSIAVDSTAHAPGAGIIYVGTGEGNGSCDSYAGVGVFKSTDSGATWSGPHGNTEFQNRSVTSIAIDRMNASHLFATSASGIFGTSCTAAPALPTRGIFESTDAGLTWTQKTAANWRGSIVMQDPVTATTWWGAMWTSGGSVDPANEGGLLKSTDNGATWTQQAGAGGLPALATSWGRAWFTGTGSTLYVANGQAGTSPGNSGRVFKSTDSGTSWTLMTAADGFCQGQCFYDMPIYTEPGNGSILYTGGAGTSQLGTLPSAFMKSTDGGATFASLVRSGDNTTALHADVHSITSWPGEPNHVWTGNDGGVWRSIDRGDNWIDVNSNLALTQFSGCDLHPTEHGGVYGGTQDNGTMGRADSNAWPHLDFGDGGFAQIDQSNPDQLVHTYFNASNFLIGVGWTVDGFAATQGQYCFSSAPGNGITISDRVLFYAPIHLDRNVTDTLYFGTHRLYSAPSFFGNSACAGAGTFSALAGGMDLAPGGGALAAIETVAGNSNLIFTGSNNGRVFRSTDGGASFSEVDAGGSALFVSDVRVDPNDNDVVFQSRSGFSGAAGMNVRKSTDGGATWAASGTGIPDIPVNALAFDPVTAGKVWAGTDIGTFMSEDGGASWVEASDGMATTAVFDLKENFNTASLVACTHGRSAYQADIAFFADGFESGDCSEWTSTGGGTC